MDWNKKTGKYRKIFQQGVRGKCGYSSLLQHLRTGQSKLLTKNQPFYKVKKLERKIYNKLPKESKAPQNVIWKHVLYGLKDGVRQFYESDREERLTIEYNQRWLDPEEIFVQESNRLKGSICSHTNDFLHAVDN